MLKHDATSVDSDSSFGAVFTPVYKSYGRGVGTFVTTALSQFKTGSGFCIQRLANSYTVRRLAAGDLTTQRAQAVTDLGTDLTMITGVLDTGNKYLWTFDDGTDTFAVLTSQDLATMLNNLLDGNFTADLTGASILNDAVATNDWIFIDSDDGKIYYGPGSATFGTNITTPLPDPEVTLSPAPTTWVG